MPVAASDIKLFLSGGQANTDKNASYGGQISTTEFVETPVEANLFANVEDPEADTGSVKYRCIYVKNDHATDTLNDPVVYIPENTNSPDTTVAIGLDAAGVGDGVTTGVAATPSGDDVSPAGVSFSSPSDPGTGLVIGATLGPQEVIAVWIRRIVNIGAGAVTLDSARIAVRGIPV